MFRNWQIWLLIIPIALAADDAWKTKRVADWTAEETKQILTNSPWAVSMTPTVKKEEKKSHGGGFPIGIPGDGQAPREPRHE